MQFNKGSAQIEAQPRPSDAACIGGPHEAPKDRCLLLVGNTDALVAYTQDHEVHGTLDPDGHLDGPALWTVLDRIAQQVGENLLNASGIQSDDQLVL